MAFISLNLPPLSWHLIPDYFSALATSRILLVRVEGKMFSGTTEWGTDRQRSLAMSLTCAVLVSVTTFLFSYGLTLWTGRSYLAILVIGVAYCCWRRDWLAGLACTLLGILTVISLLPPELTFTIDDAHDIVRIIIFTVLAGMVCTFSYVLDRRSRQLAISERQRRRTEHWLNRAQETTRFWTWEIDPDHYYMNWVNPYGILAAREFAPLEETVARLHPDDRSRFIRAVEEAFVTGEMALEFRIIGTRGLRWIMARGRMEKFGEDGARRLIGVSVDVGPQEAQEDHVSTFAGLDDLLHTIESSRQLDPETKMSVALARDLLVRLQNETVQSRQARSA